MDFEKTEKPPIGIEPKWHHDRVRQANLVAAIIRYLEAGLPIPCDWINEYNEFAKK